MRSIPRPWRTLRGRLVLAAAAGLVTAAVVFAAVGAGLIRAQSQVVARAELDRQAEQLAKLISTQAERALTRGTQVPSFEPSSIEALVGENTKLYYTGLALTPGSEQPTSEIPAVVASQIDYEVLERTGVQRIDFTQPGQQVVSEASAAPVTIGGEQFGAILLARPPGELASAWPDVAGRVVGAAGIGLGVALAPDPAPHEPHHPAAHGHAGGHPPGRARRHAHRAGVDRHPGAGRAGLRLQPDGAPDSRSATGPDA